MSGKRLSQRALRELGIAEDQIASRTSPDTPDTGAGTPLTAEEERRLRQGWWDEPPETLIPRLLATLDAARSRPATDPAGLDVERLRTAYNNILVRPGIGWPPKRSEWDEIAAEYERLARLSVADGPGPEERPDLEAAARAFVDAQDADTGHPAADAARIFDAIEQLRAALSRPLPENREEPSR